ncbi:UAA transporter family-domain-containing protein [Geopyxis carbonaria]|nr:UAA transporter family-domain-containing protein [Geopyxis carbonaria]
MARAPRRRKGSHQNPVLSTGSAASIASLPSQTVVDDPSISRKFTSRSSPPEVINQIDARPHLEGTASANGFAKTRSSVFSALAQTTIPVWATTVVMVSLIFGGCCTNVFALEAIVKVEPGSGHLITFAQFLLVAIEGFFYHIDTSSKTMLKNNLVPIHRWLIQIALFFSVSILNNHAFDYRISVPVHIILRSGGSMTTLVIGWIWGKKYSRLQIISVIILTIGCVMSALSDSKGKGESESSYMNYIMGLTILFVAQVLSAFMGLYIEATYAKYGNHYREGLFYTHALSLFLFIPLAQSMKSQFHRLASSEPLPSQPYLPVVINRIIITMPRQLLFVILNSLTQYVCIRGVNMLGAVSTALTVTIVLNIRKLVSLLLSIWLFGNKLNPGVLVGATVVFVGGFLYGIESQRQSHRRKRMGVQNRQ